MKYFLLLSCIILCSCFSEEKIEPLSTLRFEPCHNNSVELNPLIVDCPPEDIALCPIPDEPPDNWRETTLDGGCSTEIPISQKEVLFDAQGGIRCVTTSGNAGVMVGTNEGITEEERSYNCVLDGKVGWNDYTNLKCSWLASTQVGDRVVLIWVDKNETGKERKITLGVTALYCHGHFSVTQAAK